MVWRSIWNIGVGLFTRARSANKAELNGIGFAQPHIWKARAGFLDIDLNLHMNNSSYLYAMELARWHLCGICGLLGIVFKKKWMFLIGSQSIRFRHQIGPFEVYHVRSQMVYWDEKWMYILQHFINPTTGKVYAEGLVRAMLRESKRNVPTQEMLTSMGLKLERPTEMPETIRGFLEWDAASKESMEAKYH